jgi:hypothetical protein
MYVRGFVLICVAHLVASQMAEPYRTPIVFVYKFIDDLCRGNVRGDDGWAFRRYFPHYMITTLNQAVFTNHPSAEVVWISNFGDCASINPLLSERVSKEVTRVDTKDIISDATWSFLNVSESLFTHTGGDGGLWIGAALRFFYLADYMKIYKKPYIFHIEADNLLYGNISYILPSLMKGYGDSIAVTPLTSNKVMHTASVMWIGSITSLKKFMEFLIELSDRKQRYEDYLTWIRPSACCKHGTGIAEDANGNGLKKHSVNEMSMLGYYHYLYGNKALGLFPIMPSQFVYYKNRHITNFTFWADRGQEVGYALGPAIGSVSTSTEQDLATAFDMELANTFSDGNPLAITDPNSYGQFLGGTNNKGGRNKNYTDGTHVIGQSVFTNNCRVSMQCGTIPWFHRREKRRLYVSDLIQRNEKFDAAKIANSSDNNEKEAKVKVTRCFVAPMVRCGSSEGGNLQERHTPLLNLHVHFKGAMSRFASPLQSCSCDTGIID